MVNSASFMPSPVYGYFGRRWHAQVAWQTLFWRDMVLVATVTNLFMGFLALVLLSQKVDSVWVLAVHFALLPYNLFLLAAVWRWPALSSTVKWAAGAWLVMTLIV